MHLPQLIQDLGLILMAAAIVSLIFKKLKQPVVLGYLIAGFIVGPNFSFFPSVGDTQSISIWAEIGVIFMLFGLGLEFSFRKLAQVGKSAGITASFEIFFMLGVGYLVGRMFNWSSMDSLFLGGILSISSTTIIVRAFDEMGLKGRSFVSLVFGVLIVEDLIAILLLVLLSSVAVSQSLSGTELMWSSLRLGFFLVLWFLLGIYLLPMALRNIKDLLSDETLLMVSVGLCLMMVIFASHVGFSPALGAFVMGSILAETSKGVRIEHLILPVKDLFSAVFFVSVGMLIDPKILYEHFWVIVILTLVTIGGKWISTFLGALSSGRSFRNSVQAGMSLAQIGEFSFIIATLGTTLKVTSDFLYPIAVAVSAVTTFTTPYLIAAADTVAIRLEKRLPNALRQSLESYQSMMAADSQRGIFLLIWQEYGVKLVLNSVIVIAITLLMSRLALPMVEGSELGTWSLGFVSLTLSAPFLWAIFLGKPSHSVAYSAELTARLRRLQVPVAVARFLIGFVLVGFLVSSFVSLVAVSGVLVVGLIALGIFFFSRFSQPIYDRIEQRFVANLTESEKAHLRQQLPELAPWNAVLAEYLVSNASPVVAKTLQESRLKEQFGVTIAMIERGESRILAPKRDDVLLPGDKLFLIGTDEQLRSAQEVIEKKVKSDLPEMDGSFGLASVVVSEDSRFCGRTIRDCGIRESVDGLIVGVERAGVRHLNPDSSMVLLAGDLLWMVGNLSRIKNLIQ